MVFYFVRFAVRFDNRIANTERLITSGWTEAANGWRWFQCRIMRSSLLDGSVILGVMRSTTGSGAGLFERAGPSGMALNENYPRRPDGRGYPMSPLRGLPIENTSDAWRTEPNRSRNHNWYGVTQQSETEPNQFMAPIVKANFYK